MRRQDHGAARDATARHAIEDAAILLLLLLLCCNLLLLVDLSLVLWGPSRHLGSLTAANWVSFDLMFLTPLAEVTP